MRINEVIIDPQLTTFESLIDVALVSRTERNHKNLMQAADKYNNVSLWLSDEIRLLMLQDLQKDVALAKRLFGNYTSQTVTLLEEMIEYLDTDPY